MGRPDGRVKHDIDKSLKAKELKRVYTGVRYIWRRNICTGDLF